MEVNGQRVIRTGDKLVTLSDRKKKIVHYLVDLKGNLSYEEQLSKVKKIIVYNGKEVEKLLPRDFIFK